MTIASCWRRFWNCARKKPGCSASAISRTWCSTTAWPTPATPRRSFWTICASRTEPRFREENAALETFAGRKLEPWDVGYWAEKQRAALYDFDEEALRPYFSLENVVTGMFEIFGRIFGIRVEEETGVPAWDPEVKLLRDPGCGHRRESGIVLRDWFPRENKRGGAWMDSLLTGNPTAESATAPAPGLDLRQPDAARRRQARAADASRSRNHLP